MGLSILAYTLDNGYISQEAKTNIKRVVNTLGVDHIFGKTNAMNAIFADSLNTYSNVCNGCFKTIYTLSIQLALEKNIPFIVTGLSRGQFFETRLTEELFLNKQNTTKDIDNLVFEARKAYHRRKDKVNTLLNTELLFADDAVFEKVKFLDFYRYTDVTLTDMMTYLKTKLPWERPSDTGRSTNCIINDVGIYIHKKEQGYHNYAFPYSWDVRIGHKTREETIKELNDDINENNVQNILQDINYVQKTYDNNIIAYVVKEDEVVDHQLQNYLADFLPQNSIPQHFVEIESIPLTNNGKIDLTLLSQLSLVKDNINNYVAPSNQIEHLLVKIWESVFNKNKISVDDGFIQLGGHSLMLIKIASRIKETFRLDIPFAEIFNQSTISNMAKYIESVITQKLEEDEN